MGGLTEISPSAAAPRLPNTGRKPGQEQGEGAGGPLPPGAWAGGGGGGSSFESGRTGSGRRPAMDEGCEDEYYLDFLACSDVLRDEDKARWQHRLGCPCPLLLVPENCLTQGEAPNVAVTGACPQGLRGAGAGRPAAGAILAADGSDPGHSPPPRRATDGGTPTPGAVRHTESRLAPNHRQHPVSPPPDLGKNSTPSAQPAAGDRGGLGGARMGSEDSTDHWSVRAEMQSLLLKDGETSFTRNATSSASNEDDPSACHGRKTDLLTWNKYVMLSSQEDKCDRKCECDRLRTDCKILNNALIGDNVTSQSSDFKEMYHIQDDKQVQEKTSCFIMNDDVLTYMSKKYEESNRGYRAQCPKPLTDSSVGDFCIENENLEHCENSPIYDKELETLEQPSELCARNACLLPSIVCSNSKSDTFKVEDTCVSIDPYLDVPPCLTVPVQIQDISGSSNTSSTASLVDDKGSEIKLKSVSNVNTNDSDGPAHAEDIFQINKYQDSKSHEMNACGYECAHVDSKVVCPKAMLQNLDKCKELTEEFEQPAKENRTSHEGAAKSLSLPLNSTEEQERLQGNLNALKNKLREENRSTHQSMQLFETAEIEAHNKKVVSSFQETSRSATCQQEEQQPVEQPALFEGNLEIQSNKLVFFSSKSDGTDWPLQQMEYKIISTTTEPSVITHQDASTFTLTDNKKLKNNEPSPFKNPHWKSSRDFTKGINYEDILDVSYIENEGLREIENDVNHEYLGDVFHEENMNQQFCNSTETAISPVRNPSTENEHFNFQSRIVQHSNSETVLDLEDHLTALQSNNEPEVVKFSGLQSSTPGLTEQYISPLTEQNQKRLIKIEPNTARDIMECVEYPVPNEEKPSTVCIPIFDQSYSLQQAPRPIQNSVEHVVEIDMQVKYGEVQHLEDIETVETDSLKSPSIDDSNLNITQKFQPTLQNNSHLECLSTPTAEETTATDKISDIGINVAADFKCSEDSSSYFDENVAFQGEFGHPEKNSENHNVTSPRCGSEIDQGHVNDKKRSTPENLESATHSINLMMKVPPVTEQVKYLEVRSTTIGLNENSQKVEYLNDCKLNQNDVSKCSVINMNEIEGIQSKEHLAKYKEKESAVVTEEYNKTIQHNDCSQSAAVSSIELSLITHPVVGIKMNGDSDVQENCRDCSKRPRGNNLNKVNCAAVVPLKYTKTDTSSECRRKSCQMFTLPSDIIQRFSTVSKIENFPLTSKNDTSQRLPPTTHTVSIISDGQKKTFNCMPPFSFPTKSLGEKSTASIPSLKRQQATAVRIKQPLSAARNKELISGTLEKACFLRTSSELTRATTETRHLPLSLHDKQKEEPLKCICLSTDYMGKCPLEKSKQTYSSSGKENLDKNLAVIKRVYEKSTEEQPLMFEHKELKNIKHPLKNDDKAPKLMQKIHAEVFPDVSGNVKLRCLICDIHADSTIIWTKNGIVLTKAERSAGDDSPVSLAIVQTTMKDRGLYQCSLKNMYGSVSCEFDFTTEGEKIELLQPIIEKDLTNECNFNVKMCGSIATEELHFGEGLHRKAFRTKVIHGLLPLFDPGHRCVLKIHNAISHGTKANSELIKQNYVLAVQECHVQSAARQYSNMFSAEGTLLEGFGKAPEVIPIYLIHRPANNIPYATVEEELIGEFVKYSVKDGRELNSGRKESDVGLKCCTFQHWVYQWTEGNLLVTDMQGVGMKLTDIGIATSRKGYKGFKGNCSISFIDQFKALHQCNVYCKMMGLKSLNQYKPKRISPMKTQASQPIPKSTKKMPSSPQSTRRSFVRSTFGDKTSQKHL
ncbi:alpha-protein kinase 2 isoform X3 [Stegostoma tigrinum]|uniref:alpha-protein kinase 2 isoform X3 n=1 Tax=Stegostoma tigrinum TaxID=3053191 RepID=UPI00202B042F|nr:alpha-protein kinase 2 isoform X3 [Stegostoma tigrinum]